MGRLGGPLRERRSRVLLKRTFGMPPEIMVLLVLSAAALGVILSWALSVASQTSNSASVSMTDSTERSSLSPGGLPVLSENSIGAEVQRLIDTGTLQNPATFDVSACLREQGVSDQILMIEEVAWADEGESWLLVHSDTPTATIHNEGGEVNATVVRSTCGTSRSDGAAQTKLWSGSIRLNPLQ